MLLSGKKVLIVKPDDYSFYPVGYSYILGAWDKNGIKYDYVDMYLYPNFDIAKHVQENNYLAVCAGGLLGSFVFFQKLFSQVKKAKPSIACILGGNITVDFPSKIIFSATMADYIVIGEGEVTSVKLLQHIDRNGITPTDLPGVAYRNLLSTEGFEKNLRSNHLDLVINNYQPSWDFLEVDKYSLRPHCTMRLFPILTGRGCTGRCSFCSPTNGKYRQRPLEYVFEEIENSLSKYEFDYFHFLTEVFFQEEETVVEFCRRYKQLKIHKPWACLQRMDTSPQVLAEMKNAGCFTINVGVESGSTKILRKMNKGIEVDQIRNYIKYMKNCDIGVEASFMVGNYAETEEDIKQTIDFMLELGVGGPKALCVNYPGTLNFIRAQKKGLVPDILKYALGLREAYNFDWLQHAEAHLTGEVTYLNITEMDDAKLFAVVIRELRRLYEFGYHIKNASATNQGEGKYTLEGNCPFCGRKIVNEVAINNIKSFEFSYCDHCIAHQQTPFFYPTDIPELSDTYKEILPRLKKTKGIVLAGPEYALRTFIKRGYPGFDFSNVIGVIPYVREGNPIDLIYIGNLKVYNFNDLITENVDMIVSVATSIDLLSESIPPDLLDEFSAKGIRIESLFPFGIAGCDVMFSDMPCGKALAVSSAQPQFINAMLMDLHKITNARISILVQKSKEFMFSELVSDGVHVFSEEIFTEENMTDILINEIVESEYDYAMFPYSKELSKYENVVACLVKCGIKIIYAYHINNSDMPFNKKRCFLKDLRSDLNI